MLSISLKNLDEGYDDDSVYLNDIWEIEEQFEKKVDLIIDGEIKAQSPSTLVDCTTEPYSILREGSNQLKW